MLVDTERNTPSDGATMETVIFIVHQYIDNNIDMVK